jgi:uncharacterized protein
MTCSITQLWRFPVKSMGGGQVDRIRIDARGVHADRLWAVRDVEKGVTASARRLPVLLSCSARYLSEPADDAGPGNVPGVAITLPDGRELAHDDAGIHDALSELAGRELRLVALPPANVKTQHRMKVRDALTNFSAAQLRKDFGLDDTEPLPDTSVFSTRDVVTLARFSTPPGTFVDLSPVHLLSTASLRALSPDGEPYDVRRFRPNVLVDVTEPDQEFPESAWVGGELRLGTAVLEVAIPTVRCVVPTRPQPGLEVDRAITRQLLERTNRFLGVYADVATPGVVRVGDQVDVRLPAPPGALKRALTVANKSVTGATHRLLEATILRERR